MKKRAEVQKIDDRNVEKWGVAGAYVNTKGPLDPEDVDLIQHAAREVQKTVRKDGRCDK